MNQSPAKLARRVEEAAEGILAEQGFVTFFDVMMRVGVLHPVHFEAWKKGRLEVLDEVFQGGCLKAERTMDAFAQWVRGRSLKAVEIKWTRNTRNGPEEMRVLSCSTEQSDLLFRLRFYPAGTSQTVIDKNAEKLEKPADPVVFLILRDSVCSECGADLYKGDFLYMEKNQPLCLACSGFGDLEFLPSGDTALTRRAGKYSSRKAVVVQFSRSRNRYERQGLLVEPAALEQAEAECASDAPERAQARAAAAKQREKNDQKFTVEMTAEIRRLFPACPPAEAVTIAAHTAVRGSGRVGRSAAGRQLDPRALEAAVRASIRHRHTPYDELLAAGQDREDARASIAPQVEALLRRWRGTT